MEPNTRSRAAVFGGLYSTMPGDPAEVHWTAPQAFSITIWLLLTKHNVNLYFQTISKRHTYCLQAVWYIHSAHNFKRGPPMLNMHSWSQPDGDGARHAVSRRSIVSVYQLSHRCTHTHTLVILTFHIQQQPWSWLSHLSEWAAADAGTGWDEMGWGGGWRADGGSHQQIDWGMSRRQTQSYWR